MGACCCTEGTVARRFPGSAIQLSMISVSPGMAGEGTPGTSQSYVSAINEFTVEVAYQRSQGRRDHQEDYLSLLSLNHNSTRQQRHDDLFGPPGDFMTQNNTNANERDSLAGETYVPPEIHWIGIFDGHGGDRVSEFCAQTLHEEYLWRFKKLGDAKNDSSTLMRLFQETFLSFDEEIKLLQPKATVNPKEKGMTYMQGANTAGSTATVLTLHRIDENDVMITVAHCGDSRLLLFSVENMPEGDIWENQQNLKPKGMFGTASPTAATWNEHQSFLPLTKKESIRVRKALRSKFGRQWSRDVITKRIYETMDHQPTEKSEALRVVRAGGQVINNRVNGVLAVSRALGDADQKTRNGLIANPDTFSVKLSDLLKTDEERSTRTPLPTENRKSMRSGDPNVNDEEEEKDLKAITAPERDVIVVLATDGLWMYYNSEQVQGDVVELLARGYTLQQATQVMMDKVITDERGIDNTAIVILKISKPGNPFSKNVGSVGSFGSFFDQNAIRESLMPEKDKTSDKNPKPKMQEQLVPKPQPENTEAEGNDEV